MAGNNRLTIVIPNRLGENALTTLNSLGKQTFRDFEIVIVVDKNRLGANWARNEGFKSVNTEFVLFSDNDIQWEPDALETMIKVLDDNPDVSYSYGSYNIGITVQCDREFNVQELMSGNYISTMSVIRTKDFPGFDNNIKRLQDWDLWLTMLKDMKIGKYCGKKIFETFERNGISSGASIGIAEADRIIKEKHNLC
jgi:glycosyltransferase involved in cell wall biosynthesis